MRLFRKVACVLVGIYLKGRLVEFVRLLDEYAPVEIICERYTEREPHTAGQEAFTIRARLPCQSHPQTRAMI